MCNPNLMNQVPMPEHNHNHNQAHGGGAEAETDASHEGTTAVQSRTHEGPSSPSSDAHDPRRRPHRVGRRSLFRLGAASTAGIAAGAALTNAASAGSTDSSLATSLSSSPRVADLTHLLGEDFPVFYPLVDQPVIEQVRELEVDGFNANQLTINEHSGTHIDVPGHFSEGAPTVEQLPVEWLVSPLAVVRIADRAARDPETLLTVDDIRRHESRHGRLPARSFVAVDSGWWRRVETPGAFLNEGSDGVFRFPGISPEAAAFLVDERDVVGAGTDTSSLDGGVAATPLTHQTLLPAGKYGIENLAGLDSAPDRDAILVVGAPKHRGGFGGQIRALALY
jgi:kynurenine formamidase